MVEVEIAMSTTEPHRPSPSNYEDVEHAVLALIRLAERHGDPKDAALFAVRFLSIHFGLPEAATELELGADPRRLSPLYVQRASYQQMVNHIEDLARDLLSQSVPQGAAVWGVNRLIGLTGIEGVVTDPNDPGVLDGVRKHLEASEVLLARHADQISGRADAPF